MADNLRYESKRKEIEETSREQIASIRRRKTEEIRKTLIGCELADPLYAVKASGLQTPPTGDAEPFANAGDPLTAEALDAYISGFTADEYHLVTEDTNSEAFRAEAGYRVTDVPEPIPTIVVHPSDSSAVPEYFTEVCKPILGSTEPSLQETEPVDEHLEDADAVLKGYDSSVIAIVVYEDEDTENGSNSEHLTEMLTAAEARFCVLVTKGESEPDNWDFYELTDDTVLQPCARSEFETGVTEQIEAAGCPVVETQRLNEEEWTNFSSGISGFTSRVILAN